MYEHLENAADPAGLERVVIDPVSRVEGHGRITLLLDDAGRVHQARLHIVEFRGFEKFVQGRPYWEVPVMVQRLCGICPISHQLAGAKAADTIAGVDRVPPSAEKIRRLMHLGQTLQSHATHYFHLASPDLLFGFDSEPSRRNLLGVAAAHPELALHGVRVRKFGQQVIQAVTGKRIHGVGAVPGGVNRLLDETVRTELLCQVAAVIGWCEEALALTRRLYESNLDFHRDFALARSPTLSLLRPDGAHELYDGVLTVRDAEGGLLHGQVAPERYLELMRERVKPWSYMKFPYLRALGPEQGWYRVGPLARVSNATSFTTERAETARREFIQAGLAGHGALAFHWARMIEMLHAGEALAELLEDPALTRGELKASGQRREVGIGVIEAPRGTLIHHYEVGPDDLVRRANLVVSTTHNNQAMNESVRQVAATRLDGQRLDQGLLNELEVAVRAYDPCLSCATHALGRMPLEVELLDPSGCRVDALVRDGEGRVSRPAAQ